MERRIRAGEYGDRLPGFRFLAENLEVSIPTVMRAAGRLVQRGLVLSQGPRRALRIPLTEGRGPAAAATVEGVLVVTDLSLTRLTPNTRRIIDGIGEAARERGMPFACAHMAYRDAAGVHKAWDRLLAAHPSSHLVATMGTDAVVEWAKSRGIRIALLGGKTSDSAVPVFGVAVAPLLAGAIRRLRERGHSRILVPCFDAPRILFQTLAATAATAMEEEAGELTRQGLLFAEPRIGNEEALQKVLRGLRETRATALVTMNFRDYQLFATGIMRAGLRIPGDVSLVCLMGDPEETYIRPRPAHFQAPVDQILTRLRRWLHKDMRSQAGLGERWMEKAWVEGESMGSERSED